MVCSIYPQGHPAIVNRLGDFKGTNLLTDIGNRTAYISAPYLDCIAAVARQYVANIFATLRKYEYNSDLMRLYVVGGGGCLIRNFGMYDKSRATILDDICATAKSYESLAYMMFPCFLLDMEINETAKMLYMILLDWARLSQKNESWSDTNGHAFIYFTIEALAEVLHKS